MASTKEVLDHHLKAFDQGDLNGVLSDYAPDAVLFTKDGALKGVDKIRLLFEALIAEFGKPGATFHMKQQLFEGDYAYILWTAETADNAIVTSLKGKEQQQSVTDQSPGSTK